MPPLLHLLVPSSRAVMADHPPVELSAVEPRAPITGNPEWLPKQYVSICAFCVTGS